MNPALPEDVQNDFCQIARSTETEAHLIDDLLDMTRVARGKFTLDIRPLDAREVMQQALATTETDFAAKRIIVESRWEAGESAVFADPVRLQQVLWNVLKNAAKFTPEGGRVCVSSFNENQTICLQIRDTGIGMTRDELARIFDAFAQGDHARSNGGRGFGGLGLGLAISKQLITLHGGQITADSPGRGQGTVFRIILPLRRPPPADGRSLRRRETWAAPPSMPPRETRFNRVLLIEDHIATRSSLARILERRGFAVEAAGSLSEARQALHSLQFDLLISDLGLPDGSGLELAGEFHARPEMRGIALSGYGMDTDIARSRASGFSAHLVKPVNIRALEEAIASLK